MKDPFDRTKVVLRHLPPAISMSALMEQIDSKFAGGYKWVCFRPGKNSQKNQRYSRVYIDLNSLEDVLEFAEFFDGHVFVNEKGAQFKALVEYAPSQHVPKAWSKKDGREGTIFKDPEYLEFLELISKPTENLPSAEIQLERREIERAGGAKETLIVTPLMDFVRQKRAAKSGQRSSANGRLIRRSGGVSASSSSRVSTKRGSEKRRVPVPTYVLRESTKTGTGKNKSTFILASRQDGQQLSDKSVVAAASETELLEDGTGFETGRRRVLLLKGKQKEVSQACGSSSQQQYLISPVRESAGLAASKQSQQHKGSGRIVRSILSKAAGMSQSQSMVYQSERQLQALTLEKDRRLPRPPIPRAVSKDHIMLSAVAYSDNKRFQDDKISGNDLHGSVSINENQDKHSRHNGVTSISQLGAGSNKVGVEDLGIHGTRLGRVSHSPVENGSHRHVGWRGPSHGLREVDHKSDTKTSKRGGGTGYCSHEKQVWVQKSGSGS